MAHTRHSDKSIYGPIMPNIIDSASEEHHKSAHLYRFQILEGRITEAWSPEKTISGPIRACSMGLSPVSNAICNGANNQFNQTSATPSPITTSSTEFSTSLTPFQPSSYSRSIRGASRRVYKLHILDHFLYSAAYNYGSRKLLAI